MDKVNGAESLEDVELVPEVLEEAGVDLAEALLELDLAQAAQVVLRRLYRSYCRQAFLVTSLAITRPYRVSLERVVPEAQRTEIHLEEMEIR